MGDSISIHNNLTSIIARDSIAKATSDAQGAVAKLASGYAYTDPGEGIAESSIAVKMKSRVDLQDKALSIALQGNQLVDISHSSLTSLIDITSRQSALAIQAGSDNVGNAERSIMNEEFKALTDKVDIVAAQSSYNGVSLLTGQFSGDVHLNTKYETDFYEYSINNINQYTVAGSMSKDAVLESASGIKVSDGIGVTQANGSVVFAQNMVAGDRVNINGHNLVAVGDIKTAGSPKEGETFFEIGADLESSMKNMVKVLNASTDRTLAVSSYDLHISEKDKVADGINVTTKNVGSTGNLIEIKSELLDSDKIFTTSVPMEAFFENGVAEGEAVIIGKEDAYIFVQENKIPSAVPDNLSGYNVHFVKIDPVVYKTMDNLVKEINASNAEMSSKYTASTALLPSKAMTGQKGYSAGFSLTLKNPAAASPIDEIKVLASDNSNVVASAPDDEVTKSSFIHLVYASSVAASGLDTIVYKINDGTADKVNITFANVNQGAQTANQIALKDSAGGGRSLHDVLAEFLHSLETADANIDSARSSIVTNANGTSLKIVLKKDVTSNYSFSTTGKGPLGTFVGDNIATSSVTVAGAEAAATAGVTAKFVSAVKQSLVESSLAQFDVLVKGGATADDVFNGWAGGSIAIGGYTYNFAATAVAETATAATLAPGASVTDHSVASALGQIKAYQDKHASKNPTFVIDTITDLGVTGSLVTFKLNENKLAFDPTFDYKAALNQPLKIEVTSDASKKAAMDKVQMTENSVTAGSYIVGDVTSGKLVLNAKSLDSSIVAQTSEKFLASKVLTKGIEGVTVDLAAESEAVIDENAFASSIGIPPAFSFILDVDAILAGADTQLTLGDGAAINIKTLLANYRNGGTAAADALKSVVDGVNNATQGGQKVFAAESLLNNDGKIVINVRYTGSLEAEANIKAVKASFDSTKLVGLSFSSDSAVDTAIKASTVADLFVLSNTIDNAYKVNPDAVNLDKKNGIVYQIYAPPVPLTQRLVNVNGAGFVKNTDSSTLMDGLNSKVLSQGVLSFQMTETAVGSTFEDGDKMALLGQQFMFLGDAGYSQNAVGKGKSLEDALTNLTHSFNQVAPTRDMGRMSFKEVLNTDGTSKSLKIYQITIKANDHISEDDFNQSKLEIGGWANVDNSMTSTTFRGSIEEALNSGISAKEGNIIKRRDVVKDINFDNDLHGAIEDFTIAMDAGEQNGERNSLRFSVTINGELYTTGNIDLAGTTFDKDGQIISGSGYKDRGSFLAAGTELQFKHAFAQPGDVGVVAKLGKDIFVGMEGESLPEINKKLELLSKAEQRDLIAGGLVIGINAEYKKLTNVGVETINDFKGMGKFSAESGLEGTLSVMDYSGKTYASAVISFTGNSWEDSDYLDINGTKVFVKSDVGIGKSEVDTKKRLVEYLNKSRDVNIGQAIYSYNKRYNVIVARAKNLGSLGDDMYIKSHASGVDMQLNNFASTVTHVNFGQQNDKASAGSGDSLSDLVTRGTNYAQSSLLPTNVIGRIENLDLSFIEGYGISADTEGFVANKLSIGAVINGNVFNGEIEFSGGNKKNGLVNGSGFNGLGDFIAAGTKIILHSTDQKSSISFSVGRDGISLDRVIKDKLSVDNVVKDILIRMQSGMNDVSIGQERIVASFNNKRASESILNGMVAKNIKYFANDYNSDGKSKVLKGFEFDDKNDAVIANINGSKYVAKLNAMNEDGRVLIGGVRGVIVGGVGQRLIFREEDEDGLIKSSGDALILDLRNIDTINIATEEQQSIFVDALNSAFGVSNGESLSFQINAGPNDFIKFNFPDMRSENIYKNKNNESVELDISTKEGAKQAMEVLEKAIDLVQTERAKVGTMRSQFETVADQLKLSIKALKSSISILVDADIPTVSNDHMMAMVRSNAAAVAFVHSLSSLRDTVQRILQA